MKEYSLRRTVEAEQFDGRTLLAGMTRREVKDSLGYSGLRPGAMTPKGFVPMEGGDWLVRPGPTVLTDVVFNELFAEHYVVSRGSRPWKSLKS